MEVKNKLMNSQKKLKTELAYSKVEHLLSTYYEKQLEKEISKIFSKMKYKVIENLAEYYNQVMFAAHMDLILSPIHEMHKEYYETILKYKIREFDKARASGKRIVERTIKFKRKGDIINKQFTVLKADINDLVSSSIIKDKLFGTSRVAHENLANRTFSLSEKTLSRVDAQINDIIQKGYETGDGVNVVAKQVGDRFNQLKTWESRRIARTEIHNSQCLGVIKGYDDMGVEYIQWSTARDSRVRGLKPKDSADHIHMEGEIIRMGGVFSNGLMYPGDMAGPAAEIINCRCQALPFIMPFGYIAPPGMAQFREEDLVQTLDYWNQDELIATATQDTHSQLYSENYGVPLDHSLSKAKFAVPAEDLSEFGITDKGLEFIQGFQKKRFGSTREYGLAFDEKTGEILTKEYRGVENDVIIKPPKGKYSTIHYHTEDGFNPLSHGDIEDFLKKKKERVGINVSKKETWLIKQENKFNPQEINKITKDIKRFEDNQLKKMSKEFDKKQSKVNKIKDPQKRKAAQKEFDDYLNNEFIDKHNKELGDNILNYSKNVKGLNIKRVINTPIAKENVKKLPKVDVDKKYYSEMVNGSKHSTKLNSNIKDYDKYALTEYETVRYNELKVLKEKEGKLKLRNRREFKELADRKEFNELRNKILREGGDPNDYFAYSVRYEKLYKKFKDWVPKGNIEIKPIKLNKKEVNNNKDAFKLTSDEKKVYKELKQNNAGLKDDERIYKRALDDKVTLNRYHKSLTEGKLDPMHNEEYVKLYNKHKKEWNLPELSTDLKFKIDKPSYHSDELYKSINKYGLTKNEVAELEYLKKKELIGEKLSSKELKKIEFLESKDKFAYLNSVRTQGGGLNYKENLEFKKLYKQLKTKLKLDKSILKQEVTGYKSDIPLDKKAKDFKKFKGTTDDGLLPNGEEIEDYFTKDARDMNIREQEVAQRWLGSDYKAFTNFEVDCGRDVKKFEKCIYEKAKAYEKDNSLLYYKYYYEQCMNKMTGRLNKTLAKDLAESIAHDVPVLDDILNNQTKKSMTLWRVQENHNLGNAKVGDVIDFPNFRSTAISKEGALWFSGTNAKPMKYIIEIEAPAGTKGAYLAPIKTGFFGGGGKGHAHPHFGENYAKEMEFLLKKCKVEVVKIGGRKVKGANGEMLTPIKLRVVGYK